MIKTSAFIIKFKQGNTPEIDYNIDREVYLALKAFTDKEQEGFIMDDDNRTMIAFIDKSEKYKLDLIVKVATDVQPDIICKYEDITEKILYKNDFSDYSINSKLIDGFVESNLDADDVFNKIKTIGAAFLTEVDKSILMAHK